MGFRPRSSTRIDPITLIKKQCGHFGFVKSQYPQDVVSCTQCGLEDPSKAQVPIVQKKVIHKELPEMSAEEMSLWIKQVLEEE